MKKHLQHLIILLGLLAITACHRNDIRTETFEIKQLRSAEATQRIQNEFKTLNGIKKMDPDYTNNTLTVVFDGRLVFIKNIEYAIVKAGFSLPHWPANAADIAKLPKELQ